MIDLLLCQAEVPESVHQLVETILMEDRTPVSDYDWWTIGISFFAFVVSAFSLYYAWLTYNSQEKVAKNTQQLNSKSQYKIMIDMVRHLYRNLVCMLAIENKMRLSNYKIYPAEIHLQKAKVPMDIIHFELFADCNEKVYDELYKLELQLRNYNLELDAAMAHFAKKDLKDEVKKYDINTLLFKPGFLANKIVEVLAIAYEKFSITPSGIKEEAWKIIEKCNKENVDKFGKCEKWDRIKEFEPYEEKDNHFLKIFEDKKDKFFDMLNKDARIECGKNTEGEFKLLFIEFDE